MTDATAAVTPPNHHTVSGPVWLDILTKPANPEHEDVRLEILDTLRLTRSALLFGAISLTVLLVAIAFLHDPMMALLVGSTFVLSVLARLVVISDLREKHLNWNGVSRLVVSGLCYAVSISLIGSVAAFSGNPVLMVLGSLVMTGLVFGFALSNSGAPRFAQAQAWIVSLPFLLGAALSGPPAMMLVLVQTPFWLMGLHLLINTTHTRLADLVKVQRQNQYLAYSDTLTGLANRAKVMSSMHHLAKTANSTVPADYVLYLDLDGFKTVNDTYGHAVGDLLLKAVAQRLSAEVRAGDVVGRIGGDEFVIILRGMAGKDIAAFAERLTKSISRPFALTPDIEARIGVSIGGAPLGTNPDSAIADADLCLYESKHDGRNTYRLSGI